jgi:hypothetical protein
MDGKVLGFDAASGTGAIKASDGARYTFSIGDWKGTAAPKPNDDVDFEAVGGAAREIYVTRTGLNIDLGGIGAGLGGGLGGGASGVTTSPIAVKFLSSWTPVLAVLTLVFSLFPFIEFNGAGENLYGVIEGANQAKQAYAGFSALSGMFGPVETPGFVKTLMFFLSLYPLFYLIPIAAIWAVAFAVMGRPLRLPGLAHGVLAAGLPIVLVLIAGIMVKGAMPPELNGGGAGGGAGLAIGGWLIVLVGLAQLLAVFGILKGTPGQLVNRG